MIIKFLHNKKIFNFGLLFLILLIFVFLYYDLIHRIGYGDEIYPITICHNIINGKIPLVNSWTYYPGFILLAPVLYLYKISNNGYIGVAFYFKILYYILILINTIIFYFLINLKNKRNNMINLSISVLINSFVYISCNRLSYSYIFLILNLNCTFILYVYDKIKANKILLSMIFAILMFLMTLFYPTAFIIAIFWTFIIYKKNIKDKNNVYIVLTYILTGIFLTLIYIIILVCFANGIKPIIKSIVEILNLPHTKWKMSLFKSLFYNFKKYWLFVIFLLLIYFILIIIGKKYSKNKTIIVNDSYCFIYMFLFMSMVYYLSSDQQNFILTIIMVFPFFVAFCLLYINDNLLFLKNFIFICFIIIPLYLWIISPKLLGLTPSYINNKYIDYGIYKGLYTTEEEYHFITHLERDIKEYFKNIDNRNICEVTVFPATYLMADANVIAPDTWDCMGLHIANIVSWVSNRRVPIPIPSYPVTNYFESFKTKPEYMIVVDYFVKDFVNNSNKYEINSFIKENYLLDFIKDYSLSNLLIYKLAN